MVQQQRRSPTRKQESLKQVQLTIKSKVLLETKQLDEAILGNKPVFENGGINDQGDSSVTGSQKIDSKLGVEKGKGNSNMDKKPPIDYWENLRLKDKLDELERKYEGMVRTGNILGFQEGSW